MAKPVSKKDEGKLAESLIKRTHFTKMEVESLMRKFKHLTKARMDKTVFNDLLHNSFGMTEDFFMDRVFRTFDKDNDGWITIEDWILGMSVMLCGNLQEKMEFCFHVYDLKEDGYILREEVLQLLKQTLPQQPAEEDPEEGIRDLVDIIMKKMDHDHDGRLSYADYKTAVEGEPLLLEAFGPCLPDDKARLGFLATFMERHPLKKR